MTPFVPRPVVLQLPTPCVVTLMGASGAGKSTFARRLAGTAGALEVFYDQCRRHRGREREPAPSRGGGVR